ncbi:MAG: Na+/H+ antiporter subunit E [Candidatus Omnitrophica bacterium]|nr:Na+/H+ antiporter subunit E [Candidatus Omnitrophota bacterium]HOX54538.1 Na+/H+ antiporter subunit E [Candidatus Omnitrophota bacterium]
MKSRILLFIVSLLVWMLLTWPFDAQYLLAGIFVAALVSFLAGDIFSQGPQSAFQIKRYFWFLYYILLFFWEFLKANINIAITVLNPGLDIKPGIVKVKTSLKSDTALTFLANSITLAQNAISVDVNAQEKTLYVHWLNVATQDADKATGLIVKKFEKVLKRIFE